MKEFWVVYDYGMGGVWGVVHASDKEAIVDELPHLTIFEERPGFISSEQERHIRSAATFVLGELGTYPGWIASLRSQ